MSRAGRTLRALSAAALTLAGATVMLGCSQVTDQQTRSGVCAPFAVVDWTPAGSSRDVPTNTGIALGFSSYPDPDTVDGGSVLLSSGLFTRYGRYDVDLITRSIRFRPLNQLTPQV